MKAIKNISLYILLLLCPLFSFGQIPLEVSTDVLLPYPTQYSVWASEAESFTVLVSNNSDTEFEFFIRTELMGSDYNQDEVFIRFSEDYRPAQSFILAPGETRLYTSSDIQETYSNLSQTDILYSDNVPVDDVNGELPTGEYRICTQVFEFTQDVADIPVPLSPVDCSDFFTAGQASVELISPDDFLPLNSESINVFHWNVNGIDFNDASDYEYQLDIYQIDALQAEEESVYDLVEEGSAVLFHSSGPTSDLLYNFDPTLGAFPIEEDKVYAAQVTVINTGGLLFENGNKSNIMIYNSDPIEDIVPLDEGSLTDNQIDCFENCHYTLDGNTSPLADANPESFDVGNFTMSEVEISNLSNDKYSGTGKILIPWLNDILIKVNFSNIGINSDGRMISGTVYADKSTLPDYLDEATNLLNTTRLVGAVLGANTSIDLPIGIEQNIGGFNLTVAITELVFTATECTASTECNFHMPAFGEDSWISLETTDICMHPGGFGNEFIMHMGPDRPINSHGDILVSIKGSENNDAEMVKQEASYLEMDCNGVKAFSIKADVFFPENMLLPEDNTGSIVEGTVKGNLAFTIDLTQDEADNVYAVMGELDEDAPRDAGLHFIASMDIDPFQVKGIKGWGFEIGEMWIDASETANVPDIIMPEDHEDLVEGQLINTWTGFYLKQGTIALPDQFLGTQGRIDFNINHGIIDPKISMNISMNDLLGNNDGNVDGWGVSMDSVYMTINQNHLTEGGFSGQLRFPLADENQYLRYTALIGESSEEASDDSDLAYTFNIGVDSTLTFPFMISEVYLAEDSYIEGGYVTGGEGSYFESFIAGGINLDTKLFSTREDYENIAFQDFKLPFLDFGFNYHSSNGFSDVHFGLVDDDSDLDEGELDFSNMGYGIENKKESLSGLPITLKSLNIVNDGDGQKFVIEPEVILSPGTTGFSASAIVNVFSDFNFSNYKTLNLNGFGIEAMSIDIYRMGMGFSGSLHVYDDQDADGIGAKGVKGELTVALPLGVGMKMAAEFGSTTTDPKAAWNTEDNYPYWFFDGMIYFGSNGGIPIAGPIGLYGIGGGIQYNMTRSSYSTDSSAVASELSLINASDQIADGKKVDASQLRRSNNTPIPAFGTYGLKMAGTIGTCPSAALVNMDVAITAEFTSGDNMSLSLLTIEGDAFMMTPLGQRHNPQVWAGISLSYSNPVPGEYAFDGEFIAYANISPFGISLLRGVKPGNLLVSVDLHASKLDGTSQWWLHIGNPDDRCGLEIGFEDILEVSANGYFMLGHNLPTTLPVPEAVSFLFDETNKEGGNKLTSGTIQGEDERSSTSIKNSKNGKGLAFGAEAGIDLGIDQFGVYAELAITLGFDVNITNQEGLFCSNTGSEIGVNGWYGQGQIYAGLSGGLGFRVRALGKDHDLELFGLAAAVMLSGGGPNPFYADGRVGIQIRVLAGLIKCSKTLSVEVGEKCVPYYPNPFGTVPIIAETYPLDGDEDVSHFAQPQISFTLPMNEVTEISIMQPNGSFGPYYVEPYFENVQIINEGGGQFPIEEELLLKRGKLLKLDKKKSFKSNKEYSVKLTIKANEYPNGPDGYSQPVTDFGQEWKLDTVFTFTTSTEVDLNDGIEFAIPLRGQRYFLQNQVFATKLNLIEEHSEAFKQDNESYEYDYFVRYLNEDGSDPIIINIPDPPNGTSSIDWLLPEFENNKHYCMQLIRKATAGKYLNMAQNQIAFRDFEIKDKEFRVISNDTLDLGEVINPVNDLGAGEMALVTYFFKTSKYNTLEEKMAKAKSTNNNEFAWQTDILTLDTDENFDEFDVKGVKETSQTILEPLIRIFDPMEVATRTPLLVFGGDTDLFWNYTNYYQNQLVEKTKLFVDRVEEKGIESPITFGWLNYYFPDFPDLSLNYLEPKSMHRKVINYDPPLGESVINKFAESDYDNMINAVDYDLEQVSNLATNNDVQLEFVTFAKANSDAKKLHEWGEDLSADPTTLAIIEMETDEYGNGHDYKRFVNNFEALYPLTLYKSESYIGDTFYLDVYHGNFIRTPISTLKGSNLQKVKFEIE